MSAPLNQFTKDLYKLLHLPRTATQNEIKQSYRKIALALHPDRHDGCDIKTAEFKEVSEAYRILSDYSKRIEYDRWLDGVSLDSDGRIIRQRRRGTSNAAQRNPFYRKVYSPAAPPGMKTFDRQRHYDMHYGDGMMNEEIEKAVWGTHSKTMVFSEDAFMIGTFNIDNRSSFYNTEMAIFCAGSKDLTDDVRDNIKVRMGASYHLDENGRPRDGSNITEGAGVVKKLLYFMLKVPAGLLKFLL